MATTTWVESRELAIRDKSSLSKIYIHRPENHANSIHGTDSTHSVLSEHKFSQSALLLKAAKERYTLVENYPMPSILHEGEILVKVLSIGLNPIDWKAPAFNFGIPGLPWINGRDLTGRVIQVSEGCSRIHVGDTVLVPSTDYRDIRKAAFQEYAIAAHFNATRVPPSINAQDAASLGVAFVSSAIALGVSFGLEFSALASGPNLKSIFEGLDKEHIPEDIREECFSCSARSEHIRQGDWLAIWGASTTSGYITLQLAKACGLKVICVADAAQHGSRLLDAGADLLIDRHSGTERAIQIIRGVTGGRLRFGIDIVGRETATLLQKALFTSEDDGPRSHLLGFTGIPKEKDPRIVYHTIPIKLFHSSPVIGEKLATWLERLLQSDMIKLPPVVRAEGGLAGINDALSLLRNGSVSGKRVVVGL